MMRQVMRQYSGDWRAYLASVTKWLPWMVAFSFGLGFVLTFFILSRERLAFVSVTGILQSAESALTYAILRYWLAATGMLLVQCEIGFLVFWYWLANALWLLTKFAADVVMETISPDDPRFHRRHTSYLRVLRRTVGRRLDMFLCCVLFLIMVVLIESKVWAMSLRELIDTFVAIIAAITPSLWFFSWFNYWRIRITRKPKMQLAWDQYLFSKHALARVLKGWFHFALFIAFLGMALIPGLIATFQRIEEVGTQIVTDKAHYALAWSELVSNGYPGTTIILNSRVDLPSPDQLQSYLSPTGGLGQGARREVQTLQRGMFTVVVLVLVLAAGIPTVIGAILLRERRKVLRATFLSTVNTTLLFAGLSVFFRVAFFQDIASSFGLAALATFVVRFLLSLRQHM